MKAQGGVGSSGPRRPLRARRRREAAPRPRSSALGLGLLVVLAVLTLLAAVAGLRPPPALATGPLPLLAVQQAELTATGGGVTDYFGSSVALSGDTAVVGAPYRTVGSNVSQGAAYVFARDSATGTWRQQAELTATGGAANDHFGCSVALSGGVAVVTSIDTRGGQGAAYVFARDSATGTWRQQAELTATGGGAEGAFGCSVALSGDTAVVGASFRTVGSNDSQGAAYVFARDRATGTWRQQGGALTAAHGAAGDHFGVEVALSGDTAVVGAPYRTVGGNQWQGAAYVFARDRATGTWRQKGGALTAKGGGAVDAFGSSVALAGGVAMVGAPDRTVGSNAHQQGAVYVFARDHATGTWRQKGGALTAAHGVATSFFGRSVALSGGVAVVGACDNMSDQNAAYVFARDRATGIWRQQGGALTPAGSAAVDAFGSSVALAGGVAVVGAPERTVGSNAQQGAVYVFTGVGPPAVRSFAARVGSGGRVTLIWRTAAQRGLAGFFLARRVADGHWRRVNRALLPATRGAAGATYRLVDPAARAGRRATYRLRAVLSSGGSRLCGPWAVTARR